MMFSTTTLNKSRTNRTRIAFDYKVIGGTDARLSVPRSAYNALARLVHERVVDNNGIVGSVREFAKWAVNGCPCNLADELGFTDANGVYTVFRYWEGEGIVRRDGSCRIVDTVRGADSFRNTSRVPVKKAA